MTDAGTGPEAAGGDDPGTSILVAEKDAESFGDAAVGEPVEPCPLARATTAFRVEVRVVTRLAGIPLKGVRVRVAGEDFGASNERGEFAAADASRRKQLASSALQISATYENPAEKLKREEVRLDLSEVDPDARTFRGDATQKIDKVQDIKGGLRDVSFERKFRVDEDRGALEWLPADDRSDGEPILRATVRIATFSLGVRYLNQRYKDTSVVTRPGKTKDPEGAAHRVKKALDRKQEWSGSVLCSPTCGTMLVDYWQRARGGEGALDRDEVIQRYYDLWGEDGFEHRFDKTHVVASQPFTPATAAPYEEGRLLDIPPGDKYPATGRMVMQEFPPPAPEEACWWLCTSTSPHKLYSCEYAYDWEEFDLSVLDYSPKDLTVGPQPANPSPGDLWTSGDRTYRWNAHLYEWIPKAEGWWRVFVRTKWGSAPVWQFHARTAKMAGSFIKDGTAASELGYAIEGRAALTIPLDGEQEVVEVKDKKKGKKGKKKWKTVPLDPKPPETYKQWLGQGWPFVVGTNATSSGHVILVRGAVVNEAGEVEWLIVNDPYGNLASAGTVSLDFDIGGSVGQNLDNRPEDVLIVQEALGAAGCYDGEFDGVCTGAKDDPVVEGLFRYQREVLKLRKPRGYAGSTGMTVKKLGIELSSKVGLTPASRMAENKPDDVMQVQEALEALGYYDAREADGACDDELVAAIEKFEKAELRAKHPLGFIQNNSKAEKKLQKLTGAGGYSKKQEKEVNVPNKNDGDAARKGRHAYYRNSTPGSKYQLRIGPGSCARIELSLGPDEIAAQLVPGA